MIPLPLTSDILAKLEVLYHKLYSEGMYVRANTAFEAQEEIKRLQHIEEMWMQLEKRGRGRPPTGFDKKAYDRDRMRRIRAQRKLERNPGAENMIARGQELK